MNQANLMAEAAIKLARRDIMQESVVYRSIFAEGEAKGKAEKQRKITINLLRSGLSVDMVAEGTGLSIGEVQQLQQQVNEA